MVDGNGTETGHIIVTTIGGKNGQPKQVFSEIFLPRFGKRWFVVSGILQ